jgi:Fic family protein
MARTYEETHPWINFHLDMKGFDHWLWLALGEAASKCNHIAGVPLSPVVAAEMHRIYLARGALATTAIEGNTLSEDEAERIIDGKLKLPPTQQYLADELQNIVDALDVLTERISRHGKREDITVDLIKEMNRLVLKGLKLDDGVVAGERREHRVFVGPYRCAPVEDCDYLLERLCAVLNEFPLPDERPFAFCIVKAIFAHLYLVWIHPFGDGNGRTARLLELYILLSAGFPQPTGHLLSNHYNRTRSVYYEKLNGAIHGNDGVIAFIKYSVDGFIEGLVEQIQTIRQQQMTVTWINFVHDQFHDRNSAAEVRRRKLVIALSGKPEGVAISKIPDISPALAREYHGKTHKTLVRDVNELLAMNLLAKEPKGVVRARWEQIIAFLPWHAPDEPIDETLIEALAVPPLLSTEQLEVALA